MKRYSVLIGILLVVAIAYVLLVDPAGWLKPDEQTIDQGDPTRRILCDFDGSDVTAFAIIKPDGETFKFEKQAGEWDLLKEGISYTPRQERVDKLLDEVPGLKAEGLASDKRDKHASFEVDELSGIRLDVFTGSENPAVELVIGKGTSGFKGAFVRYFDADEVYRANKNVKSPVGFSFNDYRTRSPWEYDPTVAATVTVRPVEGETAGQKFRRAEGFWKTADGGNGNQNLLTELVDKLSKLTISSYVESRADETVIFEGLEPHVIVTGPSGEYELTVGTNVENQYHVADQDGFVYKIAESSLKFLLELDFEQLSFDDTVEEEEESEAPVVIE